MSPQSELFEKFKFLVENSLLKELQIVSVDPHDPIEVKHLPAPWVLLGAGNYAAAVYHPSYKDWVVKIYAEGRPGIEEEIEVYRKLGNHPAYSSCLFHGTNYLILKRLNGITLYDCLRKGIRIPEEAIYDIEEALQYARKQGLHPHDVHAKNVMLSEGKGIVVDVSDFGKEEYCSLWKDFKKAYFKLYRPFLYKFTVPIPNGILNGIRKGYRLYKDVFKRKKSGIGIPLE